MLVGSISLHTQTAIHFACTLSGMPDSAGAVALGRA
jgi:hypothetical protein